MNDPFEEELRAQRPRALSDDFVEQLGQRLERSQRQDNLPSGWRLHWVQVATPVAAAAALVLAAVWFVWGKPVPEVPAPSEQEIVMPRAEPHREDATGTPPPTLLAYSRAIGRQDGDLSDLLDDHARILLPRSPGPSSGSAP